VSQKKLMDEFMAQVESFVEEMKRSMGLPVLLDQKSGAALWYDFPPQVDCPELRRGMKVRLEVVKREPEGYYTYEWVPVEEE